MRENAWNRVFKWSCVCSVVATYRSLASCTTWLTSPMATPASCGHHWSHAGSRACRRRLCIEELGQMLVTPHIKKRGRLPRSSAEDAGPCRRPLLQEGPSCSRPLSHQEAAPSYARTTVCPPAAPARPELSQPDTQCSFNVHLCQINVSLVQNDLVFSMCVRLETLSNTDSFKVGRNRNISFYSSF